MKVIIINIIVWVRERMHSEGIARISQRTFTNGITEI